MIWTDFVSFILILRFLSQSWEGSDGVANIVLLFVDRRVLLGLLYHLQKYLLLCYWLLESLKYIERTVAAPTQPCVTPACIGNRSDF